MAQGDGTNIGDGGFHDVQGDESQTNFTGSTQENQVARKLQIPSDMRSGWLLEMAVLAWGRGSSVNGRIVMWADDADGGRKLLESPTQSWNTTKQWRRHFPSPSNTVRLESGKSYWLGFWTDITKSRYWRTNYTGEAKDRAMLRLAHVPDSWTAYGIEYGIPAIDFFYQQNANPSTGAWRAGAPTGVIPTSQPVFEGTMPHANGDGDFDHTTAVDLKVWRTDTGEMLYDREFEPTPQERSQGYFSRAPVTLPVNVPCKAKFRHRDSWSAYSLFSSERSFSVAEGPLSPTITAPSGKINVQTGYNITGVYRTNVGRSANAIRVKLLDATGSVTIFDSGWEAISLTPGQTYSFGAWHDALSYGTPYQYEVAFRDTASVIGPTERKSFKTNSPPAVPTALTPGDNRQTGERVLRATFVDPDNDPVTRAQIELWDVTSGAMVTGFPKIVTVSNNTLAYDASADMVNDRTYRWRARATDDLSTWELASPEQRFLETNYDDPTGAQPAGHTSGYYPYNGITISRNSTTRRSGGWSLQVGVPLASETRDAFADLGIWNVHPDVDLQWEAWVFSTVATSIAADRLFIQEASAGKRIIAKAAVSGVIALAANTWTRISGSGRTSSDWDGPSWLPIRPARKADNSAYDSTKTLFYDDLRVWGGTVFGRYSPWQTFTSRAAPTVTLVAPTLGGVRNRVPVPQPDFVTSPFWTEVGRVEGVDYIEVVADYDSAFGDSAWRAVQSETSTNGLISDYMTVDPTRPLLALAYAKKELPDDVAVTTFDVQCYNNANTLLGTVNPSSIAPSAGVNLTTSYRPMGGIVWPVGSANGPALPAGTTKIKFAFWPSYQSEVVVRFDAFMWDHVPLMSAADWLIAQRWFGYVDGSLLDYNPLITGPTYDWTGVVGSSESFGPHVAFDAGLNFYITYSHPTGQAKGSDRLTIYKATSTGYEQVHQTAAGGGNRTVIPMPVGVLRSESQYIAVLEVMDTNGIATTLPDLPFEVRYDGPDQLNIQVARADDDRAEVHLVFDASALPLGTFAGIEIAIGMDRTVVERILDPSATEYVWPYPLSGVDEHYWVRQIEMRGAEEVEGRWDHTTVRSEYDDWWLKDVNRPRDVALRFHPYSRDEPGQSEAPPMQSIRPWGTKRRSYIIPEARPEEGTVTIRFLDDEPTLDNDLTILAAMRDTWPVMAYLSHRPDERRFIMPTAWRRTSSHIPWRAVYELNWQEASYELDWHLREGTDST